MSLAMSCLRRAHAWSKMGARAGRGPAARGAPGDPTRRRRGNEGGERWN